MVCRSAGAARKRRSRPSNRQASPNPRRRPKASITAPFSNNLEFSVDEGSGKTVVKLVDTETNTVLRQYPTKEALAIAKDIDRFQGLLINTEA
jgi:hypothetical protein